MTEKQYGGTTGRENKGLIETKGKISHKPIKPTDKKISPVTALNKSERSETNSEQDKILLAGKISSQVKEYAKSIVKKNVPLLEIAEKIEQKIHELGGKPAFPVNTSINEIAAHYTPSYNDDSKAHGLIKIDFGVSVDGFISDTSISFDLENLEENKKLIEVAEKALENAINLIKSRRGAGGRGENEKKEIQISEIGKIIQETIESNNATPIINLSGHSIEKFDLHAGLTIPNINNKSQEILGEGLYAIEPFTTLSSGSGKVRDGAPSGIYQLINSKSPRSQLAREVLTYLAEEYKTLPFCSRWIIKKFSTRALFALKELEANGNLHQFTQLVESGNSKVAQAEHTILIDEKGEVIVTTK